MQSILLHVNGFNVRHAFVQCRSLILLDFISSVIQAADWYFGVKNFTKQPPYVKKTALVTMILCLIGLAIYIVFSVSDCF